MTERHTGGGKRSPSHADPPVKRLIDVTVASLLIAITGPVQALVAVLIRTLHGRPVLYRQRRAGRHGQPFTVFKFRSMHVHEVQSSEEQVTLDHPLVTPIGRIIRRLKIDELPQLWNVVRGEMSLVGPRPTLPEQVQAYDDYARRRLGMRPGITGWAQVNGNVALSWGDRILLDVWYVDHWSHALDARIMLKTVAVVVFGERPDPRPLEVASAYAMGTCRSG